MTYFESEVRIKSDGMDKHTRNTDEAMASTVHVTREIPYKHTLCLSFTSYTKLRVYLNVRQVCVV